MCSGVAALPVMSTVYNQTVFCDKQGNVAHSKLQWCVHHASDSQMQGAGVVAHKMCSALASSVHPVKALLV